MKTNIILIIAGIVIGIIIFDFFNNPVDTTDYKQKRDSINDELKKREQLIDSLNAKIVNLQDTLNVVETKIDSQQVVIKRIQNEKRKKVASIDTLTTSELQGYFSEHYQR